MKEEGRRRVELMKRSASGLCMVSIYFSEPASSDLEASFAAVWKAAALETIDPVDSPEPTTRNLGNARAAVGSATLTSGIWATLIVLDAGASVLPMLVQTVTSTKDEFEVYQAEVERMLSTLVVKRVERTEDAPAGVVAAEPQTAGGIPAPTRTIAVADLAGEWGYNSGITTTRYVDRYTGTYAGSESLHFTTKWTITTQGGIFLDFFGIQNGKKISEKSAGTVTLAGGVLVIKMSNTQRYVLRGWLETPEMTIMTLNGPWYDGPIPENIFTNPEQGRNLDNNWVRKK